MSSEGLFKSRVLPALIAILAGIIYAISIKYFILPSGIIMTGTEGLSIATSYFFESEVLFIILYAIFQFLLLIFSFLKIGIKFSIKTTLTLLTVISLLIFLPSIKVASPEPENEKLVLVLFGAIVSGIAKAISLKNRGSTADEDIISVFFSEKLRKPVGHISIVAGSVSTVYGLILNYIKHQDVSILVNTFMYTIIFIFVGAATVNTIYKRYKFSNILINTENAESIISLINTILPDRTYTKTEAIGGYTNKKRTIVSIIVSQEELPMIIKEVSRIEDTYFLHHYEVDGIKGRFTFNTIQ